MSQTIHFDEKFRTKLAEYFSLKSVTDNAYNHKIDAEFSGADTVHITAIAVEDLNRYDKTIDPSLASRFGPVKEVGDHKYTFHLGEDVSMDRSIDRGNNDAQNFKKRAGAVMKAYTDKIIRPRKDKHRLAKWCEQAGLHYELSADPTETTIVKSILTMHNMMIDNGAPDDGGTLFIAREWLPTLALAKEWVGLDSLGGKTLPKGYKGTLDGMGVRPVPSRWMPEGVYFAIFYKESIIAPEKINLFRGIKDSENMDGDRIQFRLKFDAFVMPNLSEGAAVACRAGTVTADPEISLSGAQATITAESGDVIYYTTDGSDPRYQSAEAKVYSAAVTLTNGDTIKACAKHSGEFWSGVVEETYVAT